MCQLIAVAQNSVAFLRTSSKSRKPSTKLASDYRFHTKQSNQLMCAIRTAMCSGSHLIILDALSDVTAKVLENCLIELICTICTCAPVRYSIHHTYRRRCRASNAAHKARLSKLCVVAACMHES
jgi:hypothetical protein